MSARKARPYLYHPAGMRMWDAWMLHDQGVTHAFHLMAPDSLDPATTERMPMGHATSSDLLHWTELPSILPPGPASGPDDMQHWTGDAVAHEGEIAHLLHGAVDAGAWAGPAHDAGSDP